MGSGDPVPTPKEGPEAADDPEAIQARRPLTAGESLPSRFRLARAADIQRCLVRGRRRRTEHLEMIWADNEAGHPRMGLLVPKFQQTAVARNRLRRRLRELWRREIRPAQPSVDLLIRARKEAYSASFEALRRELLSWRQTVAPAA